MEPLHQQEAFVSHAIAALTPMARLRLAKLIVEDRWTVSTAAKMFMVSPRTARKWADRYRAEGRAGMLDRCSRPHSSPNISSASCGFGADRVAGCSGEQPPVVPGRVGPDGRGAADVLHGGVEGDVCDYLGSKRLSTLRICDTFVKDWPRPSGGKMTKSRRWVATALAGVLAAGMSVSAAQAQPPEAPFPEAISLPDGFYPEGIAIDHRAAYVGSLADGSIWVQDLKSGQNMQFAPAPPGGGIAVGMDVDSLGRVWVAGGGPVLDPSLTPGFRVYDSDGTLLVDQPVPAGFVNDVIVTRDAAWLTDSFSPQLIRVPLLPNGAIGTPELVTLGGDWEQVPGAFNANGIVATSDQKQLIVAQSAAPDVPGAALYTVPADVTATGLAASRIALDATLTGADGLVLVGRTLFSVADEGVVEVSLRNALTTGRIEGTITVPGSITPTTADVFGSRLYVVDANFPELFGGADPTVPFQTTAVPR